MIGGKNMRLSPNELNGKTRLQCMCMKERKRWELEELSTADKKRKKRRLLTARTTGMNIDGMILVSAP